MTRFLHWSALGVAVLVAATPALAQAPRPERPYRGLFGSGTGDAGQLLTASGSVGTGWDNDVVADIVGNSGGVTEGGSRSGTVASVSGALAYSYDTDPMSVGLSVGTSARYYPGNTTDLVRGTQARATVGASPRPGTSLSMNLSVAHQPYQLSSLFPVVFEPELGEPPIPDLDLISTPDLYLRYSADLGFSQRMSRRASFQASYTQHRAERGDVAGAFSNQIAGAGLTYNLGKGLDARAGYRYGEARFSDGDTREHHAIEAGVDYNRALSISRQTTLSFGTGSTALRSKEELRFIFTGNATLNHEIGRSWNAWVGYARRVHMDETFLEPMVSDGLSVGLEGLISRRLQFNSFARGAIGKGLERDAPGFDTVHAAATLSYAVTRFMNAGLTYAFYQQRFDEGAQLSVGIPRSADRHSVRATVSLWAPLFQRSRRD